MDPKFCRFKIFFHSKLLFTTKYFTQNHSGPKRYWGPKNILDRTRLEPKKHFWPRKYFWHNMIWTKNFCMQKIRKKMASLWSWLWAQSAQGRDCTPVTDSSWRMSVRLRLFVHTCKNNLVQNKLCYCRHRRQAPCCKHYMCHIYDQAFYVWWYGWKVHL